ncbi:MAG: adenylosuccinate lyase, partial [bacterium]|nr:adenylosuccinate lyase [bacterium]
TERMQLNLDSTGGLIFSGQLLNDLSAAGMLRETAYKIVQSHAMKCWLEGGNFRETIEADPQVQACLSNDKIAHSFSLERQLVNVDKIFARVFGDTQS